MVIYRVVGRFYSLLFSLRGHIRPLEHYRQIFWIIPTRVTSHNYLRPTDELCGLL
jgi:hypothetical protein